MDTLQLILKIYAICIFFYVCISAFIHIVVSEEKKERLGTLFAMLLNIPIFFYIFKY